MSSPSISPRFGFVKSLEENPPFLLKEEEQGNRMKIFLDSV
jgi:hypothetical protein